MACSHVPSTLAVNRKACSSPDGSLAYFTAEIGGWWPLQRYSIGGDKITEVVFEQKVGLSALRPYAKPLTLLYLIVVVRTLASAMADESSCKVATTTIDMSMATGTLNAMGRI